MSNETEEPLQFTVARIVFFVLLGPILLNPQYAVDRWSKTWVYSKTETVAILLGCVLWGSVLVAITEVVL